MTTRQERSVTNRVEFGGEGPFAKHHGHVAEISVVLHPRQVCRRRSASERGVGVVKNRSDVLQIAERYASGFGSATPPNEKTAILACDLVSQDSSTH